MMFQYQQSHGVQITEQRKASTDKEYMAQHEFNVILSDKAKGIRKQ